MSEHAIVVFATMTDPFTVSKHLIDVHKRDVRTVDSLDSDALRRLHVVEHRRRSDHLHADMVESNGIAP